MKVEVSVVVPVHNEEGNVLPLINEISEAMSSIPHEIIMVDDSSRDNTYAELITGKSDVSELRVLRHTSNAGQSRAIRSGVIAACAPYIATLDGDGQNDPHDIPKLYDIFKNKKKADNLGMVQGNRKHRQDAANKKFASKWANKFRRWVLDDGAPDSGCGIKLFSKEAFLQLPYFDHMHRYMAFLMNREGYSCEFVPVNHRARQHGVSNYTNFNRAMVAISDLRGVRWLARRNKNPGAVDEA